MPTPRQSTVSSVARVLLASEVAELGATAEALPPDWVLTIEPPHGQLALSPRAGRLLYHRGIVVDGARRLICRDAGTTGAVDRLRYAP